MVITSSLGELMLDQILQYNYHLSDEWWKYIWIPICIYIYIYILTFTQFLHTKRIRPKVNFSAAFNRYEFRCLLSLRLVIFTDLSVVVKICWLYSLQRSKTLFPQIRSVLSMKLNCIWKFLEIWEMWSTSSLPLFPGPLWPKVIILSISSEWVK